MSQPLPVVPNAQAKISTLQRRHDHLSQRLQQHKDGQRPYKDTAAADYDRAEVSALESAIEVLRYHVDAIVRPIEGSALAERLHEEVHARAVVVVVLDQEGDLFVGGSAENEKIALAVAHDFLEVVTDHANHHTGAPGVRTNVAPIRD